MSQESIWEKYEISQKVLSILDVQSHSENHFFGRPFQTAYQIAIEFKKRYPNEFQQIGKPVGGINTGQSDSLAQYLALELSRRIQSRELMNIEGRFLHRRHLRSLQYNDEGAVVESSSSQSYDLSMFRRTD